MPSGPYPPRGLQLTVFSGPYPPRGGPAPAMSTRGSQESGGRLARDREDDGQRFTRTEIVSVRLANRKPRPFDVLVSIDTPGAILIESVEISICEEDEPVFNIPVSASRIVLKKRGDSHVFRPTNGQFAAISEHLE